MEDNEIIAIFARILCKKDKTRADHKIPNMIRKLILYLTLLCLVASCAKQKKTYLIGVSQCSSDVWRDKLNEELRVSSYFYGNVEINIASANDDDRRQQEQINDFIDKGVDLLIVSPNQMKTLSAALDRAYDKGIPVLLLDRRTDSEKFTAFISSDNYAVGKNLGEYAAHLLQGKGRIVEIMGLRGSSAAIERHQGLMDVLKRYPDIEVIDRRNAKWLQEPARMAMDSVLQKDSLIDLVFAQNDRMAMGAREAVLARGIKRPIKYVGVDALPYPGGGLECVKKGILAGSYVYPTRGDEVMGLAMNILEGKPYQRITQLDGALVTKDNVDVMIMQNDELSNQRSQLTDLHEKIDTYLAEYSHQRVYSLLSVIIIVLLIGSFSLAYRNIIIRRRMEKVTTEAKLTFFTNISHEFRTPLTLIADPIERLLNDASLPERQANLLRIAHKNVNVLLRLVQEILDFRKIQKGKMPMFFEPFDLSTYANQWTEGFRPMAERKQITLQTSIAEGINITADLFKVERICYNLLSNAMKYTPNGGKVNLSVTTNEETVNIQIKDSGKGMSKEDCRHIFERFYQIGNLSNSTGIGLALVKALVEAHHGTISVESTPGAGSTFTVALPRQQMETECKQAVSPTEVSPNVLPTTEEGTVSVRKDGNVFDRITDPDTLQVDLPTVLVIDDNDDVRLYINDLLRDDYDVKQAANGEEGLAIAMKQVPDIIISDVMMPGIDGLEVCRRIKKTTATSHIPVMLLTARTMEEQRAEGYDCGADAYITKPFSGKVLLARIKNLLSGRNQLKTAYGISNLPETKRGDADANFIRQLREKILSRLSETDLNVEALSTDMGLSRVQLYRKVKALTGMTPVELLRVTRLKQAERLLLSGETNVTEVSYSVGFSSPSYFIRCYKDYFGHTPKGRTNGASTATTS